MSTPPANPLASPLPWDLVVDAYVSDVVPVFSKYAADALSLADLPVGGHFLDVAAGPGTVSLLAARTAGRVVAVDFTPSMLERLRGAARLAHLSNIDTLVADGQNLPLPDAAFDAAVSAFGLIFFPDRGAGFQQLFRCLRPGRKAVVSAWTPIENVPLLHAAMASIRDNLPGLPFGAGKAPLGDPDDFRREMTAAGFRDVVIHTVAHETNYPSVAAFWTSMQRASAPIALLKQRMGTTWPDLASKILSQLEAQFGTGPGITRWPALLGVGVR